MELFVGMPVEAADGPHGEVGDIVLDPVSMKVTHLVVQPHHHHEQSHLVPITKVVTVGERVTLSMNADEVDHAPEVSRTDFIDLGPAAHDSTSGGLVWPYFTNGGLPLMLAESYSYRSGFAYGAGDLAPPTVATHIEHLPVGTVEIRRTSEVVSSDDHVVGTVDGFVVDDDDRITHLVLERGHLWKHRDVTLPVSAITGATCDRVTLRVTRDAVGDYPAVPFRRHEAVVDGQPDGAAARGGA